jgi:hypothetical protein
MSLLTQILLLIFVIICISKILSYRYLLGSRDTGWTAEVFTEGARELSPFYNVQPSSGAHSASSPMGAGGSFPRGKADDSPPSSAEAKNGDAMPPLPHTLSWRTAY